MISFPRGPPMRPVCIYPSAYQEYQQWTQAQAISHRPIQLHIWDFPDDRDGLSAA